MFSDQQHYLKLRQICTYTLVLFVFFGIILPFLITFFPGDPMQDFLPLSAKSLFHYNLWYTIFSVVLFAVLETLLIYLYPYGYTPKPGLLGLTLPCFFPAALFGALFLYELTITCNVAKPVFPLVLSSSAVLFLLFVYARLSCVLYYKLGNSENDFIKNVLIIGTGTKAQELARHITTHPHAGMRMCGFVCPKKKEVGITIEGFEVIGTIRQLPQLLKSVIVDNIIFVSDSAYMKKRSFIEEICQTTGITLSSTPSPQEDAPDNMPDEILGDIPLTNLFSLPVHNGEELFIRFFEIVAVTTFIFTSLPIWIMLAIAIRTDSKGPILFSQKRVGKNNRQFTMYKFRSMVVDAEELKESLAHLNEMDGPAFKLTNDPRVTKIGHILRKTSLDELPQLLNVLKGDISLVGPRPAINAEVEQYSAWERKRLSVIQGITCIWQISGRNNIKFDEWMKLDIMFIENKTMALYFKILLKTVPAVISAKGAS